MASSKPRTNNDRFILLFRSSFLFLFVTILASTTALANVIPFPSPSSSSSSPSASQTPEAELTNSTTGPTYLKQPPRDPPNTVYLAIEVATTDQPSSRATITLIKKVFLVDYEQMSGEDKYAVSPPGSFGSSVGSEVDAEVANDDYGNNVDHDKKSLSDLYDPGPIIRMGQTPLERTTAIFETRILLNPPVGTECTLDEVENDVPKLGRFQRMDRMRKQSYAMLKSIPSKYKPFVKLATGITCIQRQV